TATLPAPVFISANTIYVVSYHVSAGHYAFAGSFFASGPADRGPLHALADSTSSNGVFRYAPTSAFPDQSFNPSNYSVDIVFNDPVVDPTAPAVGTTAPVAGAAAVAAPSQITISFSEAMDPASITGATIGVRAGNGSTVTGTVSYDSAQLRAVFTPDAPLAY